MLVKWGTEVADSLGLKAYVQGSGMGAPMYKRHGFEGDEHVQANEGKWKDKPETRFFRLERQPKASASKSQDV